ncbi:MAG: DUF6599 family protein [Candidatus Eisenbacteria bacterium]
MLPQAGEGVVPKGAPALYSGERLYDYIDGGAPQFFEYGFREVASQELTYLGHTYIVDVYRLPDPLAAYGLFSVRRPARAPGLDGFPYSAFAGYQALLAHGPYYVEIIAYESTERTANEMAEIVRRGLGRLDPAVAPADLTLGPPFDLLPEGRVRGSERLARGPIGLQTALRQAGAQGFRSALDAVATTHGQEHPVWVVAEYPAIDLADTRASDPDGGAATDSLRLDPPGSPLLVTLAVLADSVAPAALLDAARAATLEEQVVVPEGWGAGETPGRGWCAADAGGRSWFMLSRADHLWMGLAPIETAALAAWVVAVTTGGMSDDR